MAKGWPPWPRRSSPSPAGEAAPRRRTAPAARAWPAPAPGASSTAGREHALEGDQELDHQVGREVVVGLAATDPGRELTHRGVKRPAGVVSRLAGAGAGEHGAGWRGLVTLGI